MYYALSNYWKGDEGYRVACAIADLEKLSNDLDFNFLKNKNQAYSILESARIKLLIKTNLQERAKNQIKDFKAEKLNAKAEDIYGLITELSSLLLPRKLIRLAIELQKRSNIGASRQKEAYLAIVNAVNKAIVSEDSAAQRLLLPLLEQAYNLLSPYHVLAYAQAANNVFSIKHGTVLLKEKLMPPWPKVPVTKQLHYEPSKALSWLDNPPSYLTLNSLSIRIMNDREDYLPSSIAVGKDYRSKAAERDDFSRSWQRENIEMIIDLLRLPLKNLKLNETHEKSLIESLSIFVVNAIYLDRSIFETLNFCETMGTKDAYFWYFPAHRATCAIVVEPHQASRTVKIELAADLDYSLADMTDPLMPNIYPQKLKRTFRWKASEEKAYLPESIIEIREYVETGNKS